MENNHHYNLIAEAIRFLSQEYTRQPSLEEVANHVHLSQFHFQRLFQKWVGLSPKQFLQFTTVEHAKKSLEEGRSTLETAYNVGLSGNGRLHDAFLKIKACTPGEFKKRGKGLVIQYEVIDTPFGLALIAETALGICKISFLAELIQVEKELKKDFPEAIFNKQLGQYGNLVKQYFSTWKQPDETIMLDLKGSPFQLQVWQALLNIPSGRLVSYQDIAKKIQRPKANRAVGTAIGNNPIAYLIPCHRVIKSSGEMGNYRWAPERKMVINGFEAACLSN